MSRAAIKVYAAGIASCHKGFGDRPALNLPLVKWFLQGVKRQQPVACISFPQWDLLLVLNSYASEAFLSGCVVIQDNFAAYSGLSQQGVSCQ